MQSKTIYNFLKSVITLMFFLITLAGLSIACWHLFKTFYLDKVIRIEYEDKTFKKNSDNFLMLPLNGSAEFTVKGAGESFTVDIKPNVTQENDFLYFVEGQTFKYSKVEGLYNAFNITVVKDGFVIDCNKSYSVESVLSELCGQKVNVAQNNLVFPYKLVITSSKGETLSIAFVQCPIRLTPENTVF